MLQAFLLFAAICADVADWPAANVNAPFTQDVATAYYAADGLPADGVDAIAVLEEGKPLVATPDGLVVLEGAVWKPFADPGFRVRHLVRSKNAVVAAGEAAIARWDGTAWRRESLSAPVSLLTAWGDTVATATADAIHTGYSGQAVGIEEEHGAVHALARMPEGLRTGARAGWRGLAGTDTGLYALAGTRLVPVYPRDARYSWAPVEVHALAATENAVWFGAKNGVGRLAAGGWKLFTGAEGLPHNRFTGAAAGPGETVWFGTERGALRWYGDRWSYRASRRWLPHDHVNALAVDAGGVAWFGTARGVGRIERRRMTLAEKAAFYEKRIDERHRHNGLVVAYHFAEPGRPVNITHHAGDNDGGHTAKYGTAEAFRYAATGNPEAKERAHAIFETVQKLFEMTGIPGFPARTFIPVKGNKDPNIAMGEAFNQRKQQTDPHWKNILPRWPKSEDGKYWWKCDASSDEIVSHLFFLDTYYAHCAETSEERAAVRGLVRAIVGHIVDNGFKLIDHDGRPARWANWSPEKLNTPPQWADRGLKAMQILAFLEVAQHIAGDDEFFEAERRLRETHNYHIHAMRGRAVFPPVHVVSWDDNQAFSCYYTLLRHESTPALRRLYLMSIYRNWMHVRRHNDPFYHFVFAAQAGDLAEETGWLLDGVQPDYGRLLRSAFRTLRATPLDFTHWYMENTHRLDVRLDPTGGTQAPDIGWGHDGEALPLEERSHLYLDRSHFDLDRGGKGRKEYPATMYLLPYYMGLYHGFLHE